MRKFSWQGLDSIVVLCIISSLLVFSCGCLQPYFPIAGTTPTDTSASAPVVTPVEQTPGSASDARWGNFLPGVSLPQQKADDSVLVRIYGSVQPVQYRKLRQQNYSLVPVLYSRDDPVVAYSIQEKKCWNEDISGSMEIFLDDPAIHADLRKGSIITGLNYHTPIRCGTKICDPCLWDGPVLELERSNQTLRYFLRGASTDAHRILKLD
jgi:hypothetical protein